MGQTSKNRLWKLQRVCLARESASEMSIEPQKLYGRERQAISTLFFPRTGQASPRPSDILANVWFLFLLPHLLLYEYQSPWKHPC